MFDNIFSNKKKPKQHESQVKRELDKHNEATGQKISSRKLKKWRKENPDNLIDNAD